MRLPGLQAPGEDTISAVGNLAALTTLTLDGGDGNDSFQWDPGDGSDTLDGGDGSDRLRFNGSGVSEVLDLSATGNRLLVKRDVATITLDTGNLERVDLRTLGSTDRVNVHDLTGTAAAQISVDLAGPADPNQGDGLADQVVVEGTDAVDSLTISAEGVVAKVNGLAAEVTVVHPEVAFDRLDITTLGGDDAVDNQLPPGVIQLYVDGTPQ